MIETDEQRRWWFATHPEYSWSRTGQKSKHASGHKYSAEALADWLEQHSPGHSTASRDSYDQYEDVLDRIDAYHHELWLQAIEQDKKGLVPDPHTFLDVAPLGRFITSPVQALRAALRRLAENAVVSAVKKGKTAGGPGQWVEAARSRTGLDHQSRMSGQPIMERDGKYYINEYRLNNVKFDDYRNGKLYEYKGPQGNLIKKKTDEFYGFIDTLHSDALRQAKAAQGIPVIWRVGADQVNAFKKAVGKVPGVTIIP